MKDNLRELWRGNISPIEEGLFDKELEREISFKIDRLIKKLKEKLEGDGESLELIGDLDDSYERLVSFMQEEGFINGFSLAMRLILDIK